MANLYEKKPDKTITKSKAKKISPNTERKKL